MQLESNILTLTICIKASKLKHINFLQFLNTYRTLMTVSEYLTVFEDKLLRNKQIDKCKKVELRDVSI